MSENMKVPDIVTADGGPMIVLQAGAIPLWKGAEDWDNSLMNGGTVETDYDIICDAEEQVIRRHDRDMLVLDDAEWGACILASSPGEIAVLQCFGWSEEEPVTVTMDRFRKDGPSREYRFDARDTTLRLMAGAESGSYTNYRFQEVSIKPGMKRCAVYESDRGLLFLLSDEPS